MHINNPQPDEEQLFQLWRNGDRQAYDRLFVQLYPVLCHYAVLVGLEAQEGEEVVQDCFFKLWQRRTDLAHIQQIRAYLYASVKNASFNRLKMNARKQHREHRYYEMQPNVEVSPDFLFMEAELLAELRQTIRNLPEQCGKVVWLSYMEGMSGKEIAEQLGVTVSTVNNQKARGVKLLRHRIQQHPQDGLMGVLLTALVAALQT